MMKTIPLLAALLGSVSMACAGGSGGSHKGGHQMTGDKDHWTAPKDAIQQLNPVPLNSNSISNGLKLFTELCARCHGYQALGDGPDGATLSTKPTNLKAMAGGNPDGDFAWKIKTGRGEMPAWEDELEEQEVWDLVNYIKSLSGDSPVEGSIHKH